MKTIEETFKTEKEILEEFFLKIELILYLTVLQLLYARRRRDVLWDHPWRAGGVQFFVRSISPKLY